MSFLMTYLAALVCLLAAGTITWLISLRKKDVSIVDSLWALFFLIAAAVYVGLSEFTGPRAGIVMLLVTLWAVRLSSYITWRNWGEPEDRRYQAIRERNQPNFEIRSLYLIFGLQAALAWIVSVPLLGAIASSSALNPLDFAGIALCVLGILFETVGDAQLSRFKANPANAGQVMDRGLWRYTRHPNYFGDFCVWWGFYLLALAGGAWWTAIGPALMTVFLLRVSGVSLLESDIGERRPAYADYIARTPAFLPWFPKSRTDQPGSLKEVVE
jgi:steroid 5-alpha reductase family enzyme